MPLIRNDRFIDDPWIHVTLDAELPASGDIVVPYARLLKEWEALTRHDGRLGVVFTNIERVEALTLFLPRLALIVLPFPSFTDGRAYSLARQIRETGFAGELRASGNVLPDQLQFMRQVGFDAFEVTERFAPEVLDLCDAFIARVGAYFDWKPASFTVQHRFLAADGAHELASGRETRVWCRYEAGPGTPLRGEALPQALRARLAGGA